MYQVMDTIRMGLQDPSKDRHLLPVLQKVIHDTKYSFFEVEAISIKFSPFGKLLNGPELVSTIGYSSLHFENIVAQRTGI
eukprot:c4053_g1_i1 orf=14-253(+)